MTTDWTSWLAEQMQIEVAEVEAMDDATYNATLDEYQGLLIDEMTFEQRLDCGRADAREITRTLADRLAPRLGLLDEWSGQSEAVYLRTLGGLTVARIACHEAGGVSAQMAGHEAPLVDIRLVAGRIQHDATSTHAMALPSSIEEIEQLAEQIAALLGDKIACD